MSHDVHRLLALLDRLGRPRILVLGDLILDRYTFGDAERVSQEAPVLVLRADRRESRLGGAASVSMLLRGLDAQVTLVGLVGDDAAAKQTRGLLDEAGVNHEHVLVDSSRPTTVKERFIGRAQNRHPHQILRVDQEERHAVAPGLERELLDRVLQELGKHDVLLISDYAKGVCTHHLLQAVIAAAKARKVPVVVDPVKSADYAKYRGCTTMTPNRTEAVAATGLPIRTLRDTNLLGKRLCKELDMKAAIITLDRDGMALVPPDGGGEIFPTRPRNVYDITGAGDMVLATIGLCLAAGGSLVEAVRLGNVAGGLEVERVGVAVVSRAEIRADLIASMKRGPGKRVSLPELLEKIGPHKRREKKVVFTNGCFDLLHVGHAACLQEAASHGDVLVVAVNSDASVRRNKGPARPVVAENDRAQLLAALACVDYVITFDDDTPAMLIREIQPDVLVKGGDYKAEDLVGADYVESYGGKVCVTGFVDGASTTNLLKRVSQSPDLKGPHYLRTKPPVASENWYGS